MFLLCHQISKLPVEWCVTPPPPRPSCPRVCVACWVRDIGSSGGSGDVLSLWLLRRVTAFVGQLKASLPLIEDGASLRSLLEEVSEKR